MSLGRKVSTSERVDNIIRNLNIQLVSAFSHFNEGSFKTRERYREAMERFAIFLGENYSLQKLTNFGNKHFVAYVNHMIKMAFHRGQ